MAGSTNKNSNNSTIYNEIMVPDDASKKEQTIHSFLDMLNVKEVNTKEYIEDNSTFSS